MNARFSAMRWKTRRIAMVLAVAVAVVGQVALAGQAASGAPARPSGSGAPARASGSGAPARTLGSGAPARTVSSTSVKPNPVNELDCNGWSTTYKTVRPLGGNLCTDPVKLVNGHPSRFIDNGWYVGHDEPSVKFISSAPGSGNTMSYLMKMSRDPARAPTPTGSVTDYGQLSVAPWFGLPLCDPKSYPQNHCTPDSDTNIGANVPNAAGSAFMELQFYPPGYTPFIDNPSCSATKWCAALTIDSLECTAGFGTCNNSCIEPVNFAYLQTNGVPAGPPSPQLTDVSSFMPNASTLMISPGDVVAVSITDPPQGFTTTVRDLSTGRTGTMTASAANGFMNTNISDCSGTPFTFHAEYSTASIQNRVPWAALEGGVLMEQEIGHSEVCNAVRNQDPFSATFPGGQSFSDPQVYATCVGGSDTPAPSGEGPCTSAGCQNATTQGPTGPVACPNGNPASGALCEFADGFCFAQGTRTATVNGVATRETSAANQCFANRYQNGDLDFDGLDYVPNAWPDGTSRHPTSFEYAGPFQRNGRTYPQVQFQTDVGGSSRLCNPTTGAGCTAPPISAKFYPFWSLSRLSPALASHPAGSHATACVWNFGKDLPNTRQDFGKDAQYGTPDVAWYGGTIASSPMANPEFSGRCASRF